MRVALDTNILVYAEGVNGSERKQRACVVLAELAEDEIVIPVQALGELFSVLTRKAGFTALAARDAVMAWQDAYDAVATSPAILLDAMELVADHRLSFWMDQLAARAAGSAACCLGRLMQDLHMARRYHSQSIRRRAGRAD